MHEKRANPQRSIQSISPLTPPCIKAAGRSPVGCSLASTTGSKADAPQSATCAAAAWMPCAAARSSVFLVSLLIPTNAIKINRATSAFAAAAGVASATHTHPKDPTNDDGRGVCGVWCLEARRERMGSLLVRVDAVRSVCTCVGGIGGLCLRHGVEGPGAGPSGWVWMRSIDRSIDRFVEGSSP